MVINGGSTVIPEVDSGTYYFSSIISLLLLCYKYLQKLQQPI